MNAAVFPCYEQTPLRKLTGSCLRPGGLELTRHALALCAFTPGSRVLDLGCGPGASLGLLQDQGCNCLGLDRSALLLAEAATTASVLRGDFHTLPLATSCLDGILCECALSLARDTTAVLGECFRVLRPGGRLVITDLTLRDEALPEAGPDAVPCAAGALTLREMERLLRETGFICRIREDHTPRLRELAARIVWHFGSMAAFAELWRAGDGRAESPASSSCRHSGKNLCYTLILAEKQGDKS